MYHNGRPWHHGHMHHHGYPKHHGHPHQYDPCAKDPSVLSPVVHPTKHNVVHSTQKYIVPEVHPMHTKHVKKNVFHHVHSYPHSKETVYKTHKSHHHCPPPIQRGCPW